MKVSKKVSASVDWLKFWWSDFTSTCKRDFFQGGCWQKGIKNANLIRLFPGKIDIRPAKMTVGSQFFVKTTFSKRGQKSQIELPDDTCKAEIKMLLKQCINFFIRDFAGTKGFYLDTYKSGKPDCEFR